MTAYSPFGNQNPIYGDKELLRDEPIVAEIAKKHGKTPNQILLSWGATRNVSVIPKSTNPERIKENLDIIELSQDDMAQMAKLDKNKRFNDPSTNFQYVFFADEKVRINHLAGLLHLTRPFSPPTSRHWMPSQTQVKRRSLLLRRRPVRHKGDNDLLSVER